MADHGRGGVSHHPDSNYTGGRTTLPPSLPHWSLPLCPEARPRARGGPVGEELDGGPASTPSSHSGMEADQSEASPRGRPPSSYLILPTPLSTRMLIILHRRPAQGHQLGGDSSRQLPARAPPWLQHQDAHNKNLRSSPPGCPRPQTGPHTEGRCDSGQGRSDTDTEAKLGAKRGRGGSSIRATWPKWFIKVITF